MGCWRQQRSMKLMSHNNRNYIIHMIRKWTPRLQPHEVGMSSLPLKKRKTLKMTKPTLPSCAHVEFCLWLPIMRFYFPYKLCKLLGNWFELWWHLAGSVSSMLLRYLSALTAKRKKLRIIELDSVLIKKENALFQKR